MEMQREDVKGGDLMTVTEFCSSAIGQGVKSQAIYYAMDHGKIDYVRMGNDRLVVMSERTKLYKPNEHKGRKTYTATMRTGASL